MTASLQLTLQENITAKTDAV